MFALYECEASKVGTGASEPSCPGGPLGPISPGEPAGPVGPTSPGGPAGPVDPVAPGGPAAPLGPTSPAGPAGPLGPVWFQVIFFSEPLQGVLGEDPMASLMMLPPFVQPVYTFAVDAPDASPTVVISPASARAMIAKTLTRVAPMLTPTCHLPTWTAVTGESPSAEVSDLYGRILMTAGEVGCGPWRR